MAECGKLESLLRESNLQDYLTVFRQHHITDDELHILEEAHLKELGIPLGPRLKICSALRVRGYPGRSSAATSKAMSSTNKNVSLNHSSIPRTRPPGFGSIASSPKLNSLINAYVGNNSVDQFSRQEQNCQKCFRSLCICSSPTNNLSSCTSSVSATPNLSAILEFSAFGSRASSFSPFGSLPPSSGHGHAHFSPRQQSLFSASENETSLFSSGSHAPAQMSSQVHSLFSPHNDGREEGGGTSDHSLFSSTLQNGTHDEHSLFSESGSTSVSQFAQTSSSISLPTHTNASWPSISTPSLFSSDSANISSTTKPTQTAAQALFPSAFSSSIPHTTVLFQKSSSLSTQTNQLAEGKFSPATNTKLPQPISTVATKKHLFAPSGLPSSASSLSSESGHGNALPRNSIWNETWALSLPSSVLSPSPTLVSIDIGSKTVRSDNLAERERLREQEMRASEVQCQELLRQKAEEEPSKKLISGQKDQATNNNENCSRPKTKSVGITKSKIPMTGEKSSTFVSKSTPLDKVLPRPPVSVGNSFDLLLDSNSDEEKKGRKKAKKKPLRNEAVKGTSSGSALSFASSEIICSSSSSSLQTSSGSINSKVKCECGQIVHPSVLQPTTEFQMQDRQAHLTSKRHKNFLLEQEVIAKKEKETKLKQEKMEAQRVKEEAQRAKEKAQQDIEEAQRIIEETQKAEDEANLKKNGGKKKQKKKKERKVSLVHPLGGETIEENNDSVLSALKGNSLNVKSNSNFVLESGQKISSFASTPTTATSSPSLSPYSDPKKKQLASEIQQEANQFYNKGLYTKAIERYSQGITLNPLSAVLYSNRAQAYSKCCLFEKAVEDCMKSIELDAYFVKSYHRACVCFIKIGELKKAKHILSLCAKVSSDCNIKPESGTNKKDETSFHVKIVEELEKALEEAQRWMEKNKHEKAIEILQSKVINQMQEAPIPHYLLAEAYIKEGDFLQADDVANKFIEKFPQMNETKFIKALFLYYEEAKITEAIEILKGVVEKERDNHKAQKLLRQLSKISQTKKLAEDHASKKQYHKAVETFSQVLKMDSQNECLISNLLCSRASVLFHMGHYTTAKKDLDDAVICAGSCLKARRLRASVNEKLGDWQAVVEDCQFVLDEEWDARCNEMLRSAKQSKPAQDYKGYYAALALTVDANAADIKKAYQKQILRWLPKKWANCTEEKRAEAELQYRAIAQAFEVLSDPVKRNKYDNFDNYEDGKLEFAGLEIFAFF